MGNCKNEAHNYLHSLNCCLKKRDPLYNEGGG